MNCLSKIFINLTSLTFLVLFPHLSYAGFFKCIDAKERVTYQSHPCKVGIKTIQLNFKTGLTKKKNITEPIPTVRDPVPNLPPFVQKQYIKKKK